MNFAAFLPETIVVVGAMAILLLSLLKFPNKRFVLTGFAILTVLIGLITVFTSPALEHFEQSLFLSDGIGVYARILLCALAVPILFASIDMFHEASKRQGEFLFLMLISVAGLMLMVQSTSMMSLYIAIEMASIPLYMMAGLRRNDAFSKEAVVKYFLLGAFASAMTIYGISLLYTTTGSFVFADMAKAMSGAPIEYVGFIFVLAGLCFKVAAVPFHFWAPDVYEGAPSIAVAFISVAPKVGALIAMARFFSTGIGMPMIVNTGLILSAVSALSMTVGNISAIWQKEVKRIMAYSSIAQIGYMLIAVVAISYGTNMAYSAGDTVNPSGLKIIADSYRGILLYVTAYSLMNIAAFSIIKVVRVRKGGSTLDHFKGLSKTNPPLALAMLITLVSLLGIPFASGFFGKLLVFSAGVSAQFVWLVVVAVINSTISAYYYFNIVKSMYLEAPDTEKPEQKPTLSFSAISAGFCALGALLVGLIPQIYAALEFAVKAITGGK